MSFQLMTWAMSKKCGSAASKMVLLMLANHANGHTGRCTPRNKTLAEECEMRVETLKNHLRNLEELGYVTIIPRFSEGIQMANQYNLNYGAGGGDFRMGEGGDFRPPVNQEVNQEYNQGESAALRSAMFDRFWTAYPKKVGKDAAQKAFEKRRPDEELTSEMISAIDKQVSSDGWAKEDGKYIPNPATWLNQGRWKDEVQGGSSDRGMFAGAI